MKRRHADRRAGLPKPKKTAATQTAVRTAELAGPAECEPCGQNGKVFDLSIDSNDSNDSIDSTAGAVEITQPVEVSQSIATREDRGQYEHELARADLEAVRSRLKQLEAALGRLIEEEKASAGDRFDRMARDRFVADRKDWLADPEINLPIFAASLAGTEHLARVWHDFRNSLDPQGPGPSFEQVVAAIAALGSRWRVATAQDCGVWLMARVAAISADPERAIARWVRESAAPDDTRERAMWRLQAIGEPADPRRELVEFATAEMARAHATAETLRARHAASRAAWVESSVGSGSADPALEKRLRGLHRLIAAERTRAERLQRRLDTLDKRRGESGEQVETGHSAKSRAKSAKPAPVAEKAAFEKAVAVKIESTEKALRDTAVEAAVVSEVEPTESPIAKTNAAIVEMAFPARDPFESTPGWVTDVLSGKAVTESSEVPAYEPAPSLFEAPSIFEVSPAWAADDASQDTGDETGVFDPNESPMERIQRNLEKARAELSQRTSRFRILEWGDPFAVAPKDVEVLKSLKNMPESIDREAIVRLTFGSEKTLRRAWRGYLSWCDTHEPAGVPPDAGP